MPLLPVPEIAPVNEMVSFPPLPVTFTDLAAAVVLAIVPP